MHDSDPESADNPVKQALYWASGLDFFTMPTYQKSHRHYMAMYVAFDNGLSYFQPCSVQKDMWDDPERANYTTCGVADPVSGYDARCRPWYQDASKPENRDYALVNEPYPSTPLDPEDPDYDPNVEPFIYVTVS